MHRGYIKIWEKSGMPVERKHGILKPRYDVVLCEKWLADRADRRGGSK
jgi:hypothetical protein